MGAIPRKYTDVGKREARIANDALQAKLAIEELQEQMKSVKQQKAKPASAPSPTPEPEPVQSEPSQVSPEIKYSPQIQNAQAFVNRFEQDSNPYNDLSSQDFLNSYKQGFDSRDKSTAVESVGANLNFDLPNNVETTDNNMFANNTFNPVDKANEAAQNFLTDKKKLILG